MAVAQMNAPMQMPAHRSGWSLGNDPLGLTAGWRAFRAYEALAQLDDASLAAKGLTRDDLPRIALQALKRGL